jgi:1-acyl-sn-glycerol-3-phosphate acyltransferase
MIVQAVRSLLFYVLFLGQTVLLAIVLGSMAIIMRRRTKAGWMIARYWGRSNLFLLRWVVGIRTAVSGAENIPKGPCIIAAKHQSDWDIFALLQHTSRPAFIAKSQLMNIPFFGWAAASIDTITIDRSLGANAIPAMLADARAALDRGCHIIIFPEGTRTLPFTAADYRQGIVRMYEGLDVPVVPVAVSSGLYWQRNSLVLWPGTARATILPPIAPGLDGKIFRARLTEVIETASDALLLAAVREGLTRPIPPAWRKKIARLEADSPETSERY